MSLVLFEKENHIAKVTLNASETLNAMSVAMGKEFNKQAKNQSVKTMKDFYNLFLEIRKIPQPVIASINGHAIGAGFCLAMACDLKYASSSAKMGANFAKIGLAPGMAGTYLMTRLTGPTIAAEILLTGKTFDAVTAHHYGLINHVYETEF